MFTRFVTTLILFITAAIAGCSSSEPVSGSLVVDLTAVARALGKDDEMSSMLDQARKQLNDQLLQIGVDLEQQVQDKKTALAEANEGKTSTEQDQELADFTRKANLQLQQTREVARQKAVSFRDKLVIDFRKEVMDVAAEIARERGAVRVTVAGAHLLWHESTIDITDEVIGAMRAAASEETTAPADEES